MFFSFLFYLSPPTFVPGISTFYEDGGHATITLKAKNLVKDSDIVEIFEKGNGLQFIKVGAEVIRLSKAIEKGIIVYYFVRRYAICTAIRQHLTQ